MNHQDLKLLIDLRNELRATLRASERRPRDVTDHERLEDVSFQLARTLNTLEHQLEVLDLR